MKHLFNYGLITYKRFYFMKKIIILIVLTVNISYSFAQWQHTNGPFAGGYVYDFVTSGSKIYAATGDGVFLSPDNGITWKLIGLSGKQVMTIALNGTSVIAGTYGFGVNLTTDDGLSWTGINTGLPSYVIAQALAVSGLKIYLGLAGSGVYVSTNNGASWSNVNSGMQSTNVKSIVVDGSMVIVGTFGNGVFLSTNNGASFTAVNTGLTYNTINAVAINGSSLFAGATNGGAYVSINNGASWTTINNGLTNTSVNAFAVSDSVIYAGTSNGIFKSVNNGASWISASNGLFNGNVKRISICDTNIIACVTGGIFLSQDYGNSWEMRGVIDTYVKPLLTVDSVIFAGTINAGIYYSADLGASWHASNTDMADVRINALASDGTMLLAGTSTGVYKSLDMGHSWVAANTGMTTMQINAIAISGSKIYAATNANGLFVSLNVGSTWLYTSLPISTVYSVAVSGSNIFVGAQNRIYKSTNNGTTWSLTNIGTVGSQVNALVVDGTTIFAGVGVGGVFKSTDNGTTWTAINNGLTSTSVNSLIIINQNLYASAFNGVFVSSNYGQSWQRSDNGITNPSISSLAIIDKTIFAGTSGGGVFKRSLMLTADNEIICTGASATLTAIQTLGNDSNTNYLWSNGYTGSTITVSPNSTTTYTVTATNGTLSDSTQCIVTVKSLPVVTVTGGDICYGDSITLAASYANLYIWSTGDTNTVGTTVVKPAITTSYTVIGTTPGIGCRDTAETTVTVYPVPATPTIIRTGDTLVSNVPIGNQWFWNYYPLWGNNDSNYVCTFNGDYFVMVTLNGCSSDTSNVITITDVGVKEILNDFNFTIYPNPANNHIFVKVPQKSIVEITDVEGRVVKKINNNELEINVDLRDYSNGVYFIKVINDKGQAIKKIIKQ